MKLIVAGANYRTCPLELREKLTDSAISLAHGVCGREGVVEVARLSTCHRFEVYTLLNSQRAEAELEAAVGRGLAPGVYYQHEGERAVQHLFRVSAGLDSAIPGESQVLGQVREAMESAARQGNAGPVLATLFLRAVTVGKRVRRETSLVGKYSSLGGAAVALARKVLVDLRDKRVLLVGAGKVNELTALGFHQLGVAGIWITSRTVARAQQLAQRIDATAVPFSQMAQALHFCHIMVSATTAPHSIIGRSLVAEAMEGRDFPLLIVDLALPRDVEPDVATLPNVSLFDVDSIAELVKPPVPAQGELERAEAIVAQETERFMSWLQERQAVPVIVALYRRTEELCREELDRLIASDGFSPEQSEAIQAMGRGIVRKLLHAPVTCCKTGEAQGKGSLYRDYLARLFDLEQEEGGS